MGDIWRQILAVFFSGLLLSQLAHASIILNGSRVIYEAEEREVNVKVSNVGVQPVVLQSWIDSGEVSQDPSLLKVPFLLMPALARVEAGQGQTLRLTYTGEPLPAERESVYYLNVLEIPPKGSAAKNDSTLQLAFRTRVKLFFRPKGLAGSASDAPSKLVWSLKQSGQGWVVRCSNPSAYYVSMSEISLVEGGSTKKIGEGMVAPGQQLDISLSGRPAGEVRIEYSSIDDYGAIRTGRSSLKP
ncbi:hypothetical protein BLX41_18260 [Pseudomonas protegens]|uniref:fimbrial biogenesis chaperone n=1 Tax=Pseudomonas protegens TaxID=380021 RepID=UPI000FF0A2BB|nr:fimbria/pilus periplasmic chaperone [Pseudomonas protegens]ROL72989.1 hypothetical protein BLX41_18260 [Pseudomonas protegens]